jgi:hypothetical protein
MPVQHVWMRGRTIKRGREAAIEPLPVAKPFRSHLQDAGNSEIRIRRRLEKVRYSWDNFQVSRARDAVYGYLEAVFAIVDHYKARRSADEVDSKTISKWARALRYVARCKAPPTGLKRFMKEAGGVRFDELAVVGLLDVVVA